MNSLSFFSSMVDAKMWFHLAGANEHPCRVGHATGYSSSWLSCHQGGDTPLCIVAHLQKIHLKMHFRC